MQKRKHDLWVPHVSCDYHSIVLCARERSNFNICEYRERQKSLFLPHPFFKASVPNTNAKINKESMNKKKFMSSSLMNILIKCINEILTNWIQQCRTKVIIHYDQVVFSPRIQNLFENWEMMAYKALCNLFWLPSSHSSCPTLPSPGLWCKHYSFLQLAFSKLYIWYSLHLECHSLDLPRDHSFSHWNVTSSKRLFLTTISEGESCYFLSLYFAWLFFTKYLTILFISNVICLSYLNITFLRTRFLFFNQCF